MIDLEISAMRLPTFRELHEAVGARGWQFERFGLVEDTSTEGFGIGEHKTLSNGAVVFTSNDHSVEEPVHQQLVEVRTELQQIQDLYHKR
ncbi:MAG TPA: hypothetical protein VJC10_04280 [Patescibacteria group bacterium]|nr:hypothetical protein [Patescibacteria group bacterium]